MLRPAERFRIVPVSIAVQPLGRFTVKVRTDEPVTVRLEVRSTVPPPVATAASAGCERSICSHCAPALSTAMRRSLSVNAFGFGRLATRSASVTPLASVKIAATCASV